MRAYNGIFSLNRPLSKPFLAFSILILTILTVLATILPTVAFAAAPPPGPVVSGGSFSFSDQNYFVNVILRGVLGNVIDVNGMTAAHTITGDGYLGEIFRVFNLGVSIFGLIIVLFISVVGVVQSGSDGEFLGRRWSSTFVPIRFAAGSALLLPLTSSGFSFCQAMVLWVATQGIGFADTLWETIVAKVSLPTGRVITTTMDLSNVVKNVALSEICVAAVNNVNGDARFGLSNQTYAPPPVGAVITGSIPIASMNMFWGDRTVSLTGTDPTGMREACGKMTYSFPNSNPAAVSGAGTDPYHLIRERIGAVHIAQINQIASEFRGDANSYIMALRADNAAAADPNAFLDNIIAKIPIEVKKYSDRLVQQIDLAYADSGLDTQTAENRTNMVKYGFVTAGVWYLELTKSHGAIRQGLKTPIYNSIVSERFAANPSFASIRSAYDAAQARFTSESKGAGSGIASSITRKTGPAGFESTVTEASVVDLDFDVADMVKPDAFSEFTTKVSNQIIQYVIGVGQRSNGSHNSVFDSFSSHQNPNVSSILQLKDKGDTILDITGAVMAMHVIAQAYTGAKEGTGFFGSLFSGVTSIAPAGLAANAGSGAISKLGGYIGAIVFALFVFGMTLSVFIPMIPYILWVGGILALVILILESLVAIMLWAVMLMHPSGEGITSAHNESGLKLLLVVFIRPVLMLMGLVLGMFVVEPLIMFVNDTFAMVMTSVQGGTVSIIFATIGFLIVYVGLVLTVVDRCFGLIHVIPDRVLRWIGGDGALTGEERGLRDKGEQMLVAGSMAMRGMRPRLGAAGPPLASSPLAQGSPLGKGKA